MSKSLHGGSQSFLEKFKGKTNVISKQGPTTVLNQYRYQRDVVKHSESHQLTPKNSSKKSRKIVLYKLIHPHPERMMHITKSRKMNRIILRDELSANAPLMPSHQTLPTKSLVRSSLSPLSNFKSVASEVCDRYLPIGKYLRLNKEAMEHLHFLQSIYLKLLKRKSKYSEALYTRQ